MNNKSGLGKFLYFFPRLLLVAIFLGFVALTALSNFDVIEPLLFPLHAAQGKIREVSPTIVIGHYPHGSKVRDLKKQGIVVDICLLNPALPQERALIEQLQRFAAREGIEVKNFPLSYLNLGSAENRKSVAQIVEFIRQNPGKKMYIHCYLGRHRVKVVEDELRRLGVIR
ncbi:MAG TPA: hypothetical protein HPP94_06160 [Desulfuromonadales bacterium]|nr:hypothetical protein [Desulfuromonadales bacterium]